MTIYFTADTHYGHANVIQHCNRPFGDVDEMNRELVRLYNDTVGPEDTCYHLGDFSLSARALPIVSSLNGRKILIVGNHDKCWKKPQRYQQYIDAGFEAVHHQYQLLITFAPPREAETLLLSHLPYRGDPSEKYHKDRPVDEGKWLLCGHVHSAFKVRNKQINVGVDVWDYRPVSLQQVVDIMINSSGTPA